MDMTVVSGMTDMEFSLANRALNHAAPVFAFVFPPDGVDHNKGLHHFSHVHVMLIKFNLHFGFCWELHKSTWALRASIQDS